ncbi:hypothetical protein OAO31_03430 [Gammaproteobacteria bacterium]|nr:hypothetical protein [Gammaproteobacteria bacterium]
MKSKILFLGCNYNEIPYLDNLQERGFFVVATDMNPDAPGMKIADSAIICGYNDFDGLDNAIAREGPEEFNAVFTASAQFAHLGASYISKQLEITYPSMDNVRACLDKKAFYPLFQENGIAIPETHYIRNLTELKRALSDYSAETDFYLKSDYSKNPNHIYTGKSSGLIKQEIQWIPDRYFREYYILQKTYKGHDVRLNLFPNGHELYDFETAKPIRIENFPQFQEYKILELLRKLSENLGMQSWLLKFDIIIGKEGYVVLDIGMDPPSRMKKNWEANGQNFVDFYLDLYLRS